MAKGVYVFGKVFIVGARRSVRISSVQDLANRDGSLLPPEVNDMCTMIVEKVKIDGSGKGANGWVKLEQANVSYDHPFHAPLEHALNIDFVNESQGPSARVAVELSEQAARELVRTILAVLDQAEATGQL